METINSKVMKLAHANYKEALKDHAARVAKFEANKAQMTPAQQASEVARLEKKAPAFKGCLKHAWYVCKIDYESKRDKAVKAKAAKAQAAAQAAANALIEGQTDITNDPARVEKIARNINAFNTYYDYIDTNNGQWAFFNDLRGKIGAVLFKLNQQSKAAVKALCQPQQALYFGL
nr:MAG TPA: small myristoylated protein 1 SHEET, PROTEIN TRANSPORT, MEMBRANE [Bacteriophage sp.]